MTKKSTFSLIPASSSAATRPIQLELAEKPATTSENEIALAFAALKDEVRDLRRRVEFLERENRAMRIELGDLGRRSED